MQKDVVFFVCVQAELRHFVSTVHCCSANLSITFIYFFYLLVLFDKAHTVYFFVSVPRVGSGLVFCPVCNLKLA